MTLYEMLDKTLFYQNVWIFEHNAYDQNMPLFRGRVQDARMDTERVWAYLMCEVDHYECTGGILDIYDAELMQLPSAQPKPIWGLPVSADRPLSDVEIVSRLRDIQKQIPGGSYAIDRAIEIIEAVAERRTDDTDPNCGWEICVKSERKMGHWVIIEAPLGYCNYMVCSECRNAFIEDEDYNFCPNCGADMRRREQDEQIY